MKKLMVKKRYKPSPVTPVSFWVQKIPHSINKKNGQKNHPFHFTAALKNKM